MQRPVSRFVHNSNDTDDDDDGKEGRSPYRSIPLRCSLRGWCSLLALCCSPLLVLVCWGTLIVYCPLVFALWILYVFSSDTSPRMYLFDSLEQGRLSNPTTWSWMRRIWVWDWIRLYFPSTLLFLDSDGSLERVDRIGSPSPRSHVDAAPLMYVSHPHGVCVWTAWSQFLPNTEDVLSIHPNAHRIRPTTIDLNFHIPIWREFVLSIGAMDVSAASLRTLLRFGYIPVVWPGGAREAALTDRSRMQLVLRRRRGLFRIILEERCDIRPVLSFGEQQLFRVASFPNHFLRRVFGCTLPMFYSMFGCLPESFPIYTVIGPPIRLWSSERKGVPTEDEIDKAIEMYISTLSSFHETCCTKLDSDSSMQIAAGDRILCID